MKERKTKNLFACGENHGGAIAMSAMHAMPMAIVMAMPMAWQ